MVLLVVYIASMVAATRFDDRGDADAFQIQREGTEANRRVSYLHASNAQMPDAAPAAAADLSYFKSSA